MKNSNALVLPSNSPLFTITHLLDELNNVPVGGDAEKMVLQVLGENIAYSHGLIDGLDEDIDDILADLENGFSD